MQRILGHPHYPIVIATCEDRNQGNRLHELTPRSDETPALFRVDDPFGLRMAVVPIFRADDNEILMGMGTGLAVDPWGNFMSADHVIDFIRDGSPTADGDQIIRSGCHAIALLGLGVVFGEVGVPPEALVPMVKFYTPATEVENPLNFSGGMEKRPYDVAFMRSAVTPPRNNIRNLPLRNQPSSPKVGDLVVAVGFPEIGLARGPAQELPVALTEGMYAAYGRVSALLPTGRDRSTPTPVFEVEANWPPGMSGGPVFNSAGEVIGLVSRSILPEAGRSFGTAWATWLAASVAPTIWPESVDDANLLFRSSWGSVQLEPWALEGFPSSQDEAVAMATQLGGSFVARSVCQRLGTDMFMVIS